MIDRKIIYGIIKILVFVLVILGIYFITPFGELLKNPESLRELVRSYGMLGPLVIIIIKILEYFMFVFSTGAISTGISGYLFGPFFGTLWSLVGDIIGAAIFFFIFRNFRGIFGEKWMDGKNVKKFNNFLDKKGTYAIAFTRIIPLFSKSLVTFVVGLSKMSFKKFIWVFALAAIPNTLITSMFGDQLASFNPEIILFCVVVWFVSLAILFHRQILGFSKNKKKKKIRRL